jgi:hypothetical protein
MSYRERLRAGTWQSCLSLLVGMSLVACHGATDTPDTDSPTNELGPCEEGADLGDGPLTVVDSINLKQESASSKPIHLVDIEMDLAKGIVYGVGSGGLFSLRESNGVIQFLGEFESGGVKSAYHKVTVMEGTPFVAVTSRDDGLTIVNVEDPTAMVQAGRFDANDMSSLVYRDERLYVLRHTGSVLVFDLSELTALTLSNEMEGLGNPWEIELVGDLAYVADNSLGIVVLDLQNPDFPAVLSTTSAAGGVQDLWVEEGFLYAAIGSKGIETFDLSTPSAPLSIGVTDIGRSAVAVSAANRQLWVATQEGVVTLELQDMSKPTPFASVKTEEWAMHVFANGDRGWVADWSKVVLLEVDPANVAPVADLTPDFLYLYQGDTQASMTVTNRGGATLEITGMSLNDERIQSSIDRVELAPSEQGTITLTFSDDGQPVNATLCLSSTDPSQPLREIEVSSSSSMTNVSIGEQAYDFVLSDLDGNSHRLSDQLGKPVVLAYFATW